MIASYYYSVTSHKGCSILKSESPDGPFVEITKGHVTPSDWDAIDGTLWVDDEGQPWMVFVHEWISTDDGIGRVAAARLSDDLTRFISEPVELFRADDAPWANIQVTDGCFLYKTSGGKLQMLWSNTFDKEYRVGIAESADGRVDGEWTQFEAPLFSKDVSGKHDALITVTLGSLTDERGIADRTGIDADLIRTALEHAIKILQRIDATAYRERNKDSLCDLAQNICEERAPLNRCGNIVKHKLIRAVIAVIARQLHGRGNVAHALKIHALDHSAVLDVKARDNTFGYHVFATSIASGSEIAPV
jgi:hypothetical protein